MEWQLVEAKNKFAEVVTRVLNMTATRALEGKPFYSRRRRAPPVRSRTSPTYRKRRTKTTGPGFVSKSR